MERGIKLTLPSEQVGGSSEKKMTVPHFWRGGTAGSEHDWMEPLNWYNRHVPGWFDEVVIPEATHLSNFHPVINEFVNDIAQLTIEPGAKLVVSRHGKLSIDGLSKKNIGIKNDGELVIWGELTINRTVSSNIENSGLIYNSGSLAFDQPEKKGLIQPNGGRFENFGEVLFF